jgi:YD repeat-containing protein
LVYLRKKGDTELYRKIVQFRNYGNNLLLPEKEFYKKGSGTEEERITYQDYDSRGNLLGATQSRLKTVWLWGYNKTYPVAKIEGATYGEVKNWLGESFINALAGNKNETSIKSSLKSLRSTLSNKNVLVTTYTYVPLTGIDSITAPNGTITFYVYDAQGRLIEVKDNDNKIMEQYEYHYKP